jgi:hypothetical protein
LKQVVFTYKDGYKHMFPDVLEIEETNTHYKLASPTGTLGLVQKAEVRFAVVTELKPPVEEKEEVVLPEPQAEPEYRDTPTGPRRVVRKGK